MKALVLVLLVTILGCGSKGDAGTGSTIPSAPTASALAPRIRTALADVEATSTEAQACTAAGCAAACAPNTCVGWRVNATGGCNYACLLTPAPVPK